MQDAEHLWIRRGEVLSKVRKSDLKTLVERRINFEKDDPPVRLKFDKSDVREVLRSLFQQGDSSYSISPEIQGDVVVDLRNVSFTTALRAVLLQVDAAYTIEGGVYLISRRTSSETGAPRALSINPLRGQVIQQDRRELLLQDERFIYTITGADIHKLSKADLTLVATGRLGYIGPP